MSTIEDSERLYRVARALWSSVLIGGAPPATEALRKRMMAPQPGDLVMEVSSFGRFDPDGIGILVSVVGERHESRWTVAPLHNPDVGLTWDNAEFVALPTDRPHAWAPIGD